MEQNENNKNEIDTELWQFLQNEYIYARERLDNLESKNKLFLAWDAAVFAFAIGLTDFGKIIEKLKGAVSVNTALIVICTIMLMISIICCFISFYILFSNQNVKRLFCFDIENMKMDFNKEYENIIKDYKTILSDFEEAIKKIESKVNRGVKYMKVGITLIVISEIILKILVEL